jgi:hypothetical protein
VLALEIPLQCFQQVGFSNRPASLHR